MSAPLGIGIDTGGTFTDIVLFDLATQAILRKAKTPTTHGDYRVCIAAAFAALGAAPAEKALLRRVSLSTTLATNTVAENRVHPTGLLIEPGDIRVPPGFHPHYAVLKSQVDFSANSVVPVNDAEVLAKAGAFAPAVESFAVSGYGSTRNPAHEQAIAAILRQTYGKPVVLGSELTHQLGFLQRAQAAALNAGLLPVILEWIEAVKGILAHEGIACPLYIVKGDGSLMEEAEAVQRPVQTLFSGPAASLQGGQFLAGSPDAVVIDVGGTTTDIGRVQGGRGFLRSGGLRINDRQIAVDGLDMATFGLGGDSRFRLAGARRYHFARERALPFCRAAARYAHFDLEAYVQEAQEALHFGDPDLLEGCALDEYRLGRVQGSGTRSGLPPEQQQIVEALLPGPRRIRALAQDLGLPHFERELAELIRKRIAVRIALTPTDVYTAQGLTPAFPQQEARAAVALYAASLDLHPEDFLTELADGVRQQATALLLDFLAGFDPPLPPEDRWLLRMVDLMLRPGEETGDRLDLHPAQPLVLVGAGSPVLFHRLPPSLAAQVRAPADGDVANAVGAITSHFLLRETVSIEPRKTGGVELFDHRQRLTFETLEAALAHARTWLRGELTQRSTALGLQAPAVELREQIVEDYADFSRRTRKELVYARVEALVSGMPA